MKVFYPLKSINHSIVSFHNLFNHETDTGTKPR